MTTILSHHPNTTIHNNNNHVILILDHDDNNHVCCQVLLKLLKSKFTKQQEGKKLWLERRELHYHYIPIEFSKDSHFIMKYLDQYFNLPNGECDFLKQEISTRHLQIYFTQIIKTANNNNNNLNDNESEEYALKSIEKNIETFCDIDTTLTHDKTFILKAIHRNAQVLNHIEHFYSDRQFILECIQCVEIIPSMINVNLEFLTIFANDQQIILEILKKGYTLSCFSVLSEEILYDRQVIGCGAERNPMLFSYWKECENMDRELMMKACTYNYESFKYASDELKNDRNFVMELVQLQGLSIEFASHSLKQDRQVALEAVKQNGSAFEKLSQELKNDKEILLTALEHQYPDAYIQCSDEELKRDLEIKMTVLSQDGMILGCFTNDERSDHSLVLKAIEQTPMAILNANLNLDTHQDRQLYLKAMRMFKLEQYYKIFMSGFYNLCDVIDEEMAFELVKANPIAIHALNRDLKQLYKIGYEATLLWNGYWPISYDEDYFNERIIHAYNGILINAENGQADFYRNHNKKMWPPAPSKKFQWL